LIFVELKNQEMKQKFM